MKHPTQGACVAPYIYEYAPDGTLQGYQVRFKRTLEPGRTESRSLYFSIGKCGSADRAFQQAEQWRDRNARWLDDRKFELKLPRPARRATAA
jgi:hypothetical protein